MLPSKSAEIKAAQESTGFANPPPYLDILLQLGYGEYAQSLIQVFGCPSDGGDCEEGFGRLLMARGWYCNTRWAISGTIKQNSSQYG